MRGVWGGGRGGAAAHVCEVEDLDDAADRVVRAGPHVPDAEVVVRVLEALERLDRGQAGARERLELAREEEPRVAQDVASVCTRARAESESGHSGRDEARGNGFRGFK